MKCCCLCCRSSWLIITKPQILAAGHVRLHCPWPWWTRKDISPSEAFTDSCQPEHLVATVPDTVSRRENTTVLTGIWILSFTLLPGLLGAHSCLPIPLPGSADHPPLAGHTSVLSPCHSAQGHCGIRIPEDWTQAGVSAHEVWLCQSLPDGPGTRQALCVWPEETAETRGHKAPSARRCPHGKQGWRFCYCLNKQNSWRQQSSYQYFCRIKIQVSKNRVSLKLDLNQTT